jgi:hypothetical protein
LHSLSPAEAIRSFTDSLANLESGLRPAIIVNEDAIGILPLRVIVLLTDWKEHYQIAPWMVRIDPNTSSRLFAASCT